MLREPSNDDGDTTETELTLGLPGGGGERKRVFSETVDLSLGRPETAKSGGDSPESGAGKPSTAKARVVGWPPVRSYRKNALNAGAGKYVKVAVDGAPYLRKVDLQSYGGYQQLMTGLVRMFACFTIRTSPEESRLVDPVSGTEYVPTYEDKEGDWMLVGDVPWKMFIELCKRIRLMKSSEAVNLGKQLFPKLKHL
ncbi:Auxin-responsive protein IAA1 [Acorus calamus]|uniref:Auxin-responsive protein n=1 Tax=Acorus calamus TaxID=4465 RepID=A0AAV9C0A5_ACOCL|nr:Auxin-responsive protein IAA1 [Acorus calamus]